MELPDFLNIKMFQLIVLINIITNYYTFAVIDDDIQDLKGVQGFPEPKKLDNDIQTFNGMKDFSEPQNSGQKGISVNDQGLEPSSQLNSLQPVGVIYLMEREIAHRSTGNLKSESGSIMKKERNLKDLTSETGHLSSSGKRSVSLETGLFGLPDVEIDTRFYSHSKSVSHSSLDHSYQTRSNLNSKNTEGKSKNTNEENTVDDLSELNKIKTANEENSGIFNDEGEEGGQRRMESSNDVQNDDPESSLARAEKLKQYTKQKNVSINRIKYVNSNRRQTGAINSRPLVTESVLTNQNPGELLSPLITQDLLEIRSQARSLNELGPTSVNSKSTIKREVVGRDGNLLTVGNLLPPLGLLLGLETGLRYSKHPVSAELRGLQSPKELQNLVGVQTLAKSKNQQDSTDLTDRSRNELIEGPLERGGNLLSIGNPIPPVGLSLGLQTGSKNSRRPLNNVAGQVGSLLPTGIQNLLGSINPLKSEDQLDYADFNFRSGTGKFNEDLKRDRDLLAVADPLPTAKMLLNAQAEPKHASYSVATGQVTKKNSLNLKGIEKSETKQDALDVIDRSGNEINKQLERTGKLISIGNPLPPVGLLVGLQTGSKNTKDSNGNLLTIGNPLPPVGLQLGVQTG